MKESVTFIINVLSFSSLQVSGAKGLLAADIVSNTSDPYCIIRVGKVEHKTPVVKKTLEPAWNTSFTMYASLSPLFHPSPPSFLVLPNSLFLYSNVSSSPVINSVTATLEVTVMDHDMIGSDDFLGYPFPLSTLLFCFLSSSAFSIQLLLFGCLILLFIIEYYH